MMWPSSTKIPGVTMNLNSTWRFPGLLPVPGCVDPIWRRDASQRGGQEAEYPRNLGRRHRHFQYQRLQHGHDGLQDAEHRPHRQGRCGLHRLVWSTELHRRPRGVHHRAVANPHGPHQGRSARRQGGLTKADPTLAELLKPLGYSTGQFGKNHLGDRNDMLPTVHGFDEWLGNLYHLNAEEEPENVDYPKNPAFKARFGPRGVLHCFASGKDDSADDPRFGKMGKQVCTDTGPLTRKRMETIDDELHGRRNLFLGRVVGADAFASGANASYAAAKSGKAQQR